ncbi:MAG: hypothetical protein D3923_03740 [Candidatus Electrothrix sp. AR3]|nr:hypothetical protein [Candidatus Electrothrix sp. AR3]
MKQQSKKKKSKECYCMDCGIIIDPFLAMNIETTKKHLNMPNMLIFCDDCQFKMKNRLRRIWNGCKYLFE